MLNKITRRVTLHEGHGQHKLSEGVPLLDSIPTSSLHGEGDDPELYAWEHRSRQHQEGKAFVDFRTRIELTRFRMRRLLSAVEPISQSGNLYLTLTSLRAAHGRYGETNPNRHLMAVAPGNGSGFAGLGIGDRTHFNVGIYSPQDAGLAHSPRQWQLHAHRYEPRQLVWQHQLEPTSRREGGP